MVELPKEKQERTQELIVKAQGAGSTNLKDVRFLCGKLSHVTLLVPEERHPGTLWRYLEQQHEDLSWWDEYLAKPEVAMQLCTAQVPDDSLGLFCDASGSYGIGIVTDGGYDSLKFIHNWRTVHGAHHDIGWVEALALELLITFLFKPLPLYDIHLLVHTDNTGVIGAWNKHPSRNEYHHRTYPTCSTTQPVFVVSCLHRVCSEPSRCPLMGRRYTRKVFKGYLSRVSWQICGHRQYNQINRLFLHHCRASELHSAKRKGLHQTHGKVPSGPLTRNASRYIF
jgi:hypothetical protein